MKWSNQEYLIDEQYIQFLAEKNRSVTTHENLIYSEKVTENQGSV